MYSPVTSFGAPSIGKCIYCEAADTTRQFLAFSHDPFHCATCGNVKTDLWATHKSQRLSQRTA